MTVKFNKKFKRIGIASGTVAVAATVALMLAAGGAAQAAPPGQSVNPDNYPCGGSDHHAYNASSPTNPNLHWYHTWIYKNCSNTGAWASVVFNDGSRNGGCWLLSPGQAMSLDDSYWGSSASPYSYTSHGC